jgi:TetR/AcrR family transcriptional regulator, regulator of mycofactocin system
VALDLFAERGFEATTVEEIAAAVGVGRRTLFRYFESKNDIAWGDFDWVMGRLREALDEGAALPLMEALRRGVVESNRYPPEQLPGLRTRMTLITGSAALQAHSALRYAEWRGVVAEWAAGRLGEGPDDLRPRVLGYAALGSAMASFERWVASEDEDPIALIDAAFLALAAGFTTAAEQ